MTSDPNKKRAPAATSTEAIRRATPTAAEAMENARRNVPLIGITASVAAERLTAWAASMQRATSERKAAPANGRDFVVQP